MRSLLAVVVAAVLILVLGPASTAVPAPSGLPAPVADQARCRRTLPTYPQILPGTTSGAVRALQCVLNDTDLGPVTVDGTYGRQTQAAITKLTDGFECCISRPLLVRTWYWTILFSRSHRLRGLEPGDSGLRVRTLQRALRADGETIALDGDFGAQTEDRVKVFQRKCDIRQTGRVNGQTSFFLSQGGCTG
jgi:peptidoglycan hydrolase-like protein with peptidoglycan-binding domain